MKDSSKFRLLAYVYFVLAFLSLIACFVIVIISDFAPQILIGYYELALVLELVLGIFTFFAAFRAIHYLYKFINLSQDKSENKDLDD